MVMDLGPNGKHVAGCHDRFRYEDVSAAGGTSFAGRPHPSHTLVGFTIRTEDDIITSLKFICGWCQPKRGVQNRGGCAFIRSRTRQNAKRIFSRAYALGSSPWGGTKTFTKERNTMKKRFLSVLTALALCLTLLPAQSLAAGTAPSSVTLAWGLLESGKS